MSCKTPVKIRVIIGKINQRRNPGARVGGALDGVHLAGQDGSMRADIKAERAGEGAADLGQRGH